MPNLLRFLGIRGRSGPDHGKQADEALDPITLALDALDPDRARFFAAFAYVLARVAGADLKMDASESDSMAETLAQLTGISTDDAGLVAEIACSRMDDFEATHNYLVTREFGRLSDTAE